MSEANSTAPCTTGKPGKPRPDFPLIPDATRRWAKKIRGKLHYFGPWDDPQGALDTYFEQKDALHAGRKPREDRENVTVKDLCNEFLTEKRQVDGGELSPRTFACYKEVCVLMAKQLGKGRLAADLDPAGSICSAMFALE
jgi:hypothetical protein